MKFISLIVAVESYLLRKGITAVLRRIESVRVTREFDESASLLEHTKTHGMPNLVISDTLYDECREFFIAHPEMLEKTLLLHIPGSGSLEEEKRFSSSLSLMAGKEEILEKIRSFLELENDPSSQPELTEREKTIVRLISMGMTNKQIAGRLFLSTHTVTTHRKNITAKLGIKSASGLTVYAIVNNIVTIEEASTVHTQ